MCFANMILPRQSPSRVFSLYNSISNYGFPLQLIFKPFTVWRAVCHLPSGKYLAIFVGKGGALWVVPSDPKWGAIHTVKDPALRCSNILHSLANGLRNLVVVANEAGLAVGEGVEGGLAMVGAHPTVANTSKWQVMDYKRTWLTYKTKTFLHKLTMHLIQQLTMNPEF